MSHVSKQIYRKIYNIFPDLENKEPFSSSDFKIKGANINMVVLDSSPDEINVVLSRYGKGQLFANLSVEICVNPKAKTAYVKTYKDHDYSHSAIGQPSENNEMEVNQANGYCYHWLSNLKNWKRTQNTEKMPSFSR